MIENHTFKKGGIAFPDVGIVQDELINQNTISIVQDELINQNTISLQG